MSAVKFAPETENVCAAEAVLGQLLNTFNEPVTVIEGNKIDT